MPDCKLKMVSIVCPLLVLVLQVFTLFMPVHTVDLVRSLYKFSTMVVRVDGEDSVAF